MKFPILFLPALLEIALVLALHAQTSTPSTLTTAQRATEIRELRAEQKSIAARLDTLEAHGHEFLPRGMDADASTPSRNPSTSEPPLAPASPPQPPAPESAGTPSITGAPHA